VPRHHFKNINFRCSAALSRVHPVPRVLIAGVYLLLRICEEGAEEWWIVCVSNSVRWAIAIVWVKEKGLDDNVYWRLCMSACA
jgi:hypothetical protein